MKNKIGILGGTFDPIHSGHIKIAKDVKNELELDEIWIVPANYHIFKNSKEITNSIHRLNMIKIALENETNFKLIDIEIKRKKISYTYDTISEFKRMYPLSEFFFILGADNFNKLNQWKQVNLLFQQCKIVIFGRENVELNDVGKKYLSQAIAISGSLVNISSSEIRAHYRKIKTQHPYITKKIHEYIVANNIYLNTVST